MLKEELAEIVQHLTDAQAEINSLYEIADITPNLYHEHRGAAVLLARKLWFKGSKQVLTEGGWENSNQHLMKKDKDNETKKEPCTEPIWPGECPAPKPGTVTPDGDETIIMPIVQ